MQRFNIPNKNVKIVWIGGRDYPNGGWEYNLKNDVLAANIVLESGVELWQVPRNVYRMMSVTLAELKHRVFPCGAIGLMLFEDCGEWELIPAPKIGEDLQYIHNKNNRLIRVYKNIDARFIIEDLYAKLKLLEE